MTEEKRAFEMTIDIEASVDDVWRALTEAKELVRWFPLEARVTPGQGGSMFWSWGEAWAGEMRIDAWDPPWLLRLVEDGYRPFDAEGRPLSAGQVEPTQIALEFTLETREGKTRLRLVHSGFGRGANWDDEFEGISTGWQFELRSLRHYLRRHRGRDRHAGWARIATTEPPAAVWARLLSPEGFPVNGASLEAGRPYALKAATGDHFTGTVELYLPPWDFFGTVRELNDGVFRLSTHRAAGQTGVTIWLATYTPDTARVEAFGTRAQELLQRLFATG